MKLLERIEKLLVNESSISTKVRKTMVGLIQKPGKANIDINGMKVTSKPTKDGVIFTIPADDFEMSMAITDVIDSVGGYRFNTKKSKQHMTFEVKPK